jgi:hypothetical protein
MVQEQEELLPGDHGAGIGCGKTGCPYFRGIKKRKFGC